jgi:aminoglycoside phosphotransferase family enzyme
MMPAGTRERRGWNDPGRDPSFAEKVEFLRRPEVYAERSASIEAIETHMSWVFLTSLHAYKLKKPIRYDVLDFSRLEFRERSCRRELRLNRRRAPDVYLAVVALTRQPDGQLALDGAGPPVDWLVKMRRLPADRMLDRVIEAGGIRREDVEGAATLLADFYARAVSATVDGEGYRKHLVEGVEGDRDELLKPEYGLSAADVARICETQLRYLDSAALPFDDRVTHDRVVEGHGDLRPEHICLTDPPAIIDCLEFSRDLRILDPADELSFLALECTRLGASQVGSWFLEAYCRLTADEPPHELLAFYRRFRALRRAKIAVWHLREPGADGSDEWRRRADWYVAHAAREAERALS